MDKAPQHDSRTSREGRWLMIIAVLLVVSSLGGTVWVFLNKENHARKAGRQLPPSAQTASPPAAQAAPPAAK